MPREPRMDSALVLDNEGLWVKEGRRLKKGDMVAVGSAEDGSEGIYVYTGSFLGDEEGEFKFMTSEVSREKPIDYALMAHILIEERDRSGYPIWVTGPALVHSRARADMVWFIENGFVAALLAGNAVAVHDIEASIFGTTLGMTRTGEATTGGHGLHMRAINKVRAAGSISKAVEQGIIKDGIMRACVLKGVPFVLTGSIRDDGPLPEVITDTLAAQDAMKRHTTRATMAVLIATALHAIATGNMLPAFVTEKDGSLRELPTICVDSSEFVVSKLKDRAIIVHRHTVFTARYRHTLKGPDRGKWEVDVQAEADAPLVTLDQVVRGVMKRAGEPFEPEKISASAFKTIVESAAPG